MGIEDLLDDISAEEARAASEAMADIEFEDEIQTRLPEDLRYGGLYGLMSYLGMQGQGDQGRAIIKPKGMPRREEGQRTTNIYGSYYLPEADADRIAERIDQGIGLDFYQGSYPRPDEIRYFQATDSDLRDRGGEILDGIEGYGGYGGPDDVSNTINHELVHRAQSLPFLEDRLKDLEIEMLDEDLSVSQLSRLRSEYERLNDFVGRDHYYLDALADKYPNTPEERRERAENTEIYGRYPIGGNEIRLRDLKKLQDDTRNYLTPEKQEELGVRLPIPAAKPKTPSLMERLEDYAKDIF